MTEENKANKIEGFDEPTGPFARKKGEGEENFTPSAQDQAEAEDAFGQSYADESDESTEEAPSEESAS